MSEVLKKITEAGTSIWLDDLSRERMIEGGKARHLSELIAHDWVLGVTTNPAIFSSAISGSDLYRRDIESMRSNGLSAEEIITELTTADVQRACDYFLETYERTQGVDGRVSIEVDPRLARDTQGTLIQARQLWQKVNRRNLLIKVPATREGLPAIRTLISEGISVNVTIIFSVTRYREVLEAFISGLEDRGSKGESIDGIHSVASFFISRVDTEIDARLRSSGENLELCGRAALSNARLAYQHFLDVMNSERWNALAKMGGAIQRPLWASTGVKDPSYDPTMYVVELVAPHTVNTMPEATLNALRATGAFKGETITDHFERSAGDLAALAEIGIDIEAVAEKLENEGIDKFINPWLDLIEKVASL